MAKKQVSREDNDIYYKISIKKVPSYPVLSLRRKIPSYYDEKLLWEELCDFMAREKIDSTGNSFSIYHDLDYKEKNVDVELCIPIKKKKENLGNFIYKNTKAVNYMASTMVYGDFSNIARVYLEFSSWLRKNTSYKNYGKTRQIIHRGPWNEDNSNNYLIELQVPLYCI